MPGACKARIVGCSLEMYKMIYPLYIMGIKPRTILDIGAYLGIFSKCANYIFPDAAIYAFEPLKDRYEELCGLKGEIDKLECYNVALAEKAGETFIHRSSRDYSSSLLEMDDLHKEAFPDTAGERLEKVQIQTLNKILAGKNLTKPILMKIDVQGYEKFVLDGADKVIEEVDYIICEMSFRTLYKGQPLFDAVYRQLNGFGFRFYGPLAERRHPKTSEVLQIDGLFIRQK